MRNLLMFTIVSCLLIAGVDASAPNPMCPMPLRPVAAMTDAVGEFTNNHPAVMAVYADFISAFEEEGITLEEEYIPLVEAVVFAAKKHRKQVRKGPEHIPYIIHPLRVARSLWREGQVRDPNILAAALLHDTVEDTDTRPIEIYHHFGVEVCGMVAEVTDDKSLPRAARKELQVLKGPYKSPGAKMIKLADKLDNLRDIVYSAWSEEQIIEYYAWAARVVDGIRGTNAHLEALLDDQLSEVLPTRPELAV